MKVKILTAPNERILEQQVNELLAKGWELTDTLVIDQFSNLITIVKKI
jgi:hypothetical protein